MKFKLFFVCVGAFLLMLNFVSAQDSNKVLAEVNGAKLTYGFLIDQFPEEYRAAITPEQISRMVENWIDTELMYQEALKHNVQKDKRIMNVIEQQRKEIIAARYADLTLDINAELTDSQIDSVYQANKEVFTTQEPMYHLSHIVLSTKSAADAVYSRLTSGSDFATLVKDYSEDEQSRKNNGDIGMLVESGLEPVIVEGLRAAKQGSYTKPIKSQTGFYHVFWVKEKIAAGTLLKLEDIKSEIAESVKAEKQQKAYQDMISRLRSAAAIKRNSLDEVFSE